LNCTGKDIFNMRKSGNIVAIMLPFLLVISISTSISAAAKQSIGSSSLQNAHKQKSICALKPSTIPYYAEAKQGRIKVHEEGEEGTSGRSGLIPVGKKLHLLKMPTEKIARNWAEFLCGNLKSLDAVNFPTGKWPQVPGKNCTLEKVEAFIIDTGAFKNTAVVQLTRKAA
jgi:hypothetical protein